MLNSTQLTKLKNEVQAIIPQLINIRHTLHQNPELAFQENKSQKIIEHHLTKLGYNLFDKFIETDVVTEINNNKKKTIIIRADMDALPINEEGQISYKSNHQGIAHSCGHDGHMTILLGVATVLKKFNQQLPVNIRLVFQPAEEMAGGGRIMVENDITKNIDYAYALHCWPKLKTGSIQCCPNTIFAAGSFFSITLTGEGCHGATPELGNSPFPPMAKLIKKVSKLHQKHYKKNGSVISICTVNAGQAASVIPNDIEIKGTIRYLDKNYGATIKEDLQKQITKIAAKFNTQASISFTDDILPTINNHQAYTHVKNTASKYLGEENFIEMIPTKTMEDFAYFLDKVPGALFMLGVGEDKPSLHNPSFNFNDEALTNGILMFCLLALTHPTNEK